MSLTTNVFGESSTWADDTSAEEPLPSVCRICTREKVCHAGERLGRRGSEVMGA